MYLIESCGYSVFSSKTEKHTQPLSHRHYCAKHQPPLLLQRVAISIRKTFAREDMYVHADVERCARYMACWCSLTLASSTCVAMSMRYVLNYFIVVFQSCEAINTHAYALVLFMSDMHRIYTFDPSSQLGTDNSYIRTSSIFHTHKSM